MNDLPDRVETLRRMVNADIAEFNEQGGGLPAEVLSLFGALMEKFFLSLPEIKRQRYWDAFKRTMVKKIGVQ